MKKLFFLLCVIIYFMPTAFCANDDNGIVITDKQIPNKYAGVVLNNYYTVSQLKSALENYFGKKLYLEEFRHGTGKYIDFVASKNSNGLLEFGGNNWDYVRTLMTGGGKLLTIEFNSTSKDLNLLRPEYNRLKNAFSNKYGEAKEHQSGEENLICSWRNDKYMVSLSLEKDIDTNGKMLCFLSLAYLSYSDETFDLFSSGDSEL